MKKERTQQEILRAACKRLKVSKAELADRLGKSAPTLDAWLAPVGAGRHRTMPKGARLLLARIVAEHKAK